MVNYLLLLNQKTKYFDVDCYKISNLDLLIFLEFNKLSLEKRIL